MLDQRLTHGKVKVFSNTAEPGFSGRVKRVIALGRRRPVQVAGVLTRNILRRGSRYRLLDFPQSVHIEITNRCNLACTMCPHSDMERPQGLMSRETFRAVIDELAGRRLLLENVALMGLGEPLLHPEFEAFARQAAKKRIPNLTTSTNGTALTESRARRILKDGALDRLIISLDGAAKDSFESVRVGANFEQVMHNAQRFLEIKKEMRARRPAVTLQILLMRETQGEIDAFCRRWTPHLGRNDEILIKEADTFGGLVEDSRLVSPQEAPRRTACRQLWKDISISWDGRVTVCCKDVFYRLEVGRVGERLADIWRSAGWEAYRRLHRQDHWERLDPCDKCREWYL